MTLGSIGSQVTSFQPADYREPQQSIVGYLRNYSDEEQVNFCPFCAYIASDRILIFHKGRFSGEM